jgi:hypothetical protein
MVKEKESSQLIGEEPVPYDAELREREGEVVLGRMDPTGINFMKPHFGHEVF